MRTDRVVFGVVWWCNVANRLVALVECMSPAGCDALLECKCRVLYRDCVGNPGILGRFAPGGVCRSMDRGWKSAKSASN